MTQNDSSAKRIAKVQIFEYCRKGRTFQTVKESEQKETKNTSESESSFVIPFMNWFTLRHNDLHDENKENSRDFSVNVIISNFSGENNEKQWINNLIYVDFCAKMKKTNKNNIKKNENYYE